MMIATSIETGPTMVWYARRVIFLVALLAAWPRAGDAQQAPLGPTRVTLVASNNVARGARTEVVRRAQQTPQNVIFVDQNATPEDLAGAIAMIQALRIQHGDQLPFDVRARPEVVRQRPTWQQSEYRTWLIEQLVRLRKAPRAPLTDLGVVGAVQVTVPAARGTVTSGGARP